MRGLSFMRTPPRAFSGSGGVSGKLGWYV